MNFSFLLFLLFCCSGMLSAFVFCKVTIPHNSFFNSVGCAIQGKIAGQYSPSVFGLEPIAVQNALECRNQCLAYTRLADGIVKLYSESNHIGFMGTLREGNHPSADNFGGHDKLSSVRVGGCFWVEFFEHSNYRGSDSKIVHGPANVNLDGWHDKASSAKVYRKSGNSDYCDNYGTASTITPLIVGCKQYYFDSQAKKCHLYSQSVYSNGYEDREGDITGNVVCEHTDKVALLQTLADKDGCIENGYDYYGNDVDVKNNIANAGECREKCIGKSNCAVFTYDSVAKKCYLKTQFSVNNRQTANNRISGLRFCSTCAPGYVLSNNSCRKCRAGYYCPNGKEEKICPERNYCPAGSISKIACATNQYCPEGSSSFDTVCPSDRHDNHCSQQVKCLTPSRGTCNKNGCWNFAGNGLCSSCKNEYSGKICHHNVCKNSELAQHLQLHNSHTISPSNFGWEKYKAEDVRVYQEIQGSGDFGLSVEYISISKDFAQHRLLLNNNDKTGSTSQADCSTRQKSSFDFVVLGKDQTFSIGENIQVCVKGIWSRDQEYAPNKWDRSNGNSGTLRANPMACLDYQYKFQSLVKFKVSDFSGNTAVENANIDYTVGNSKYNSISGANGIAQKNLVVGEISSTQTKLTINKVESPNDGEFVLCTGVPCVEENRISLPTQVDITHLNDNPQMFYLADTTAVGLIGTVSFDFQNSVCEISNATVRVYDATKLKEVGLLGETVTAPDGEFGLSVPRQSKVRMEVEYHDHTFVGDGNNFLTTNDGIQVGETIQGLKFKDATKRKFSMKAFITECEFNIGKYDITLTVPKCSAGNEALTITSETGAPIDEYLLPAHEFAFQVEFSGIKNGDNSPFVDGGTIFDYFTKMKFPEKDRYFDLSDQDQTIMFIYQTNPVVETQVAVGLFPPEKYPESCESQPAPFDFALEGGRYAELVFEMKQPYVDGQFCTSKVPPNTQILVRSSLGVANDTCSWENDGCFVPVERELNQGLNQSVARKYVFTGEPEAVGDSINDFVKVVKIDVVNPNEWDGYKQQPDLRMLLLGHKPITENSLVSYFAEHQDHVPILYLYAPPVAGESYQQITMSLARSMESSAMFNQDIEYGGGGFAGVKIQASDICIPLVGCSKLVDTDNSITFGGQDYKTDNQVFDHTVSTTIEGKEVTFKTPVGKTGKDGNMVLLVGTVSKFITSKFMYFDMDTCKIESRDSAVWGGSEMESLLFYSRNDCEAEVDKLDKTIQIKQQELANPAITNEEKKEAEKLLQLAEISKGKWLQLFTHWDDDFNQAKNNEYDLRDAIKNEIGEGNRINYGASEITIKTTTQSTTSSIVDYSSSGHAVSFTTQGDSFIVAGVGVQVGVTAGYNFEHTTTTKIENVNTSSTENLIEVEVLLSDNDSGDKTCLEVYKSPHSGTLVFDVCGGETRCPHIPKTDAKEKIKVDMIEQPVEGLVEDDGRIVLEISNIDMAPEDSLDLVVELDAASALLPVQFQIGGASLNQPLEFTLEQPQRVQATIFFKRLDPNLQSIQVQGVVRSKCDPSIHARFPFTVRWKSACPPVTFGSALQPYDSTWEITASQENLQITAKNPTGTKWKDTKNNIDVEVSLWARLYDRVNDDWTKVDPSYLKLSQDADSPIGNFVDNEDNSGSSSLWLHNKQSNLFRNGERYLLELRSTCYQNVGEREVLAGETRSGLRLGVVDLIGPKLVGHSNTQNVNLPSLGVPIAKLTFDEPIDCTFPSLEATVVSTVDTTLSAPATIYCSGRAHQLNIVLLLENDAQVKKWSETKVEVYLDGVLDLYGNPYLRNGMPIDDDDDISNGRVLKPDLIEMNFTLPKLHPLTQETKPWAVPTSTQIENEINEQKKKMLPRIVQPSAHVLNGETFENESLSPTKSPTTKDSGQPDNNTPTPENSNDATNKQTFSIISFILVAISLFL